MVCSRYVGRVEALAVASGVGTVVMFPQTGYTGQDSFTYKVNDGTVDSAVATVTPVVS